MNLTRLALKRPVSAVLLIIMIVVFGISSFASLEQELTPEMESPMLLVMTIYSGANPEDVEDLITSKIEDRVSTLSDVKKVQTSSSENQSMVMVEYQYGVDLDDAYDDLKKKIDSIERELPDAAEDPMIMEMSMDQEDTMNISVRGEVTGGLYNYVENNIEPELEKLSGVASVSSYGGQQEYISITLQRDRMEQYGLTMSDVTSAVSSADFTMPAGDVDVGALNLSVSTGMSYDTMESLKNITISLKSGQIIQLKDIATITMAQKEQQFLSSYDGQETVNIGIAKQQSATAKQVSENVNQLLEKLEPTLPEGLTIEVVNDSYDGIKSSLESVQSTLILAIVISMIILFLFLGDVKASLIVASSMPVSVLAAFIMMRFADFSLNIISMASLVIGVGMMVDNSIVVLESCFRSRAKGKSLFEAALDGTKEVTASIVAGTITTIVVYLPLALISGMSGQLFKPLGFIIAFAMVASLLSAMTIVPLAYYFYRPVEKEHAPLSGVMRRVSAGYEKFLRKSIHKKKTVFLITLLLLVVSVASVSHVKMELMPAGDEGTISVSVTTRPGIQLDEKKEILAEVEEIITSCGDMEHYMLMDSTYMVELKDDRKMSTQEIMDVWKVDMRRILNCDVEISNSSAMSSMSMADDALQFRLVSSDYDDLKEAASEVVAMLNKRSDVALATSSLANAAPIIKIEIDPVQAAAEGFTPAQIASSVNALMSGKEATTITEDGQEYSVYVEYPADEYDSIEDIQSITLTNASGNSVALSDMAQIVYKDSPQTIQKEDGYYNMTIDVEVKPENLEQAKTSINQAVMSYSLPEGVSFGTNSIQQQMDEEFGSLYEAIASAIFLVFMVMAMQFESPRFSLMVMTCIPFSFVGSFLFVSLSGSSISMTSLMGFLMLIGSVVNNGILYVDTVNQNKLSMELDDALVAAGVTRLRPILMTSLTTILGLTPLAIGIGENSEMMQGFAVVAIGGMTASTLLALLLLPTFYNVMQKKAKKPRGGKPSFMTKGRQMQLFARKKARQLDETVDQVSNAMIDR
ncbi:MAG: efflux RND transporter permease subunit [Peptococcaceae bacterium]